MDRGGTDISTGFKKVGCDKRDFEAWKGAPNELDVEGKQRRSADPIGQYQRMWDEGSDWLTLY
jgi:hypothetical protein